MMNTCDMVVAIRVYRSRSVYESSKVESMLETSDVEKTIAMRTTIKSGLTSPLLASPWVAAPTIGCRIDDVPKKISRSTNVPAMPPARPANDFNTNVKKVSLRGPNIS